MATISPLGGVPVPGPQFGRPVGGFPGPFPGGIRPGFGGDADPITPGNQSTPGVVTATGPTQFVQGGIGARGFPGVGPIPGQPGFIPGPNRFIPGAVGVSGGVVDADPITPGVQAQPGVVTPVGPPRVVGGPQQGAFGGPIGSGFGAGGFNTTRTVTTNVTGGLPIGGGLPVGVALGSGIAGGVIDADPITPGIQAQPGVVTPVGPPRVVGSSIATGAVGFGDADPITPGLQTQRGVLTATGPTTAVGGGMLSSGVISGPPVNFQTSIIPAPAVLTSGIASSNFQQNINYTGGALIDADPVTPGIQSQPGTITQTGPTTIVGGGAVGTSFATPLVDVDPITPGIQAQPGVLTATGPSTFVSGYQQAGYQQVGYQQNVGAYQQVVGGGVIDADPITPGVQAQAGIITPTGPPVVVGYGNQNCCPWWLWPLLCILLLAGLLGGLYAYFSRRNQSRSQSQDQQNDQEQRDVTTQCSGYLNKNGDCVDCPQGSRWNGKTCTYKSSKTTTTTTTTTTRRANAEQTDQSSGNSAGASARDSSSTQSDSATSANAATTPAAAVSQESAATTTTNSGSQSSEASGSQSAGNGTGATDSQNAQSSSSSSESSASNSGSSNSSSSDSSNSNTKRTRTVTKTITTHRDEVVDPVSSEPQHKHLKRYVA